MRCTKEARRYLLLTFHKVGVYYWNNQPPVVAVSKNRGKTVFPHFPKQLTTVIFAGYEDSRLLPSVVI